MSRREPFTAVPLRVDRAIDTEDLDPQLGCLLKRLIYRCGAKAETTFTLDELAAWLRGWQFTTEKLRQDLHRLDRLGWVSVTSPGPGRNVWQVRLVGATLEFKSNASKAAAPATPADSTLEGESPIPTPEARFVTPVDTDIDVDRRSTAVGLRRSISHEHSLAALVDEIADRDQKTYTTLAKLNASEHELAWARERLRWRRTPAARQLHGPITTEAGYVYDQLNNAEHYMTESGAAA